MPHSQWRVRWSDATRETECRYAVGGKFDMSGNTHERLLRSGTAVLDQQRDRIVSSSERRVRGLITVVWLTALFLLAPGQVAGQPVLVPGGTPEYVENCGVNVTYLTLRYFGIDQPVTQIARKLAAGPRFERFVSVADIRRCLISNDLAAEGFKAKDVRSMLKKLDTKRVIIAYLRPTTENALGHFVFLALGKGGQIIIADPPSPPSSQTLKATLEAPALARATGEFLLISRPEMSAAGRQPRIHVAKKNIDLGKILWGTEQITAQIEIKNAGNGVLEIKEVSGPCNCFVGYKGERKLAAGAQSTIKVFFNRNSMPSGRQTRRVVIESNDPEQNSVEVEFAMDLEPESNAPPGVRWAPTALDFGRIRRHKLGESKRVVTIWKWKDEQHSDPLEVQRIECTSSLLEVTPFETTVPQPLDKATETNRLPVLSFSIKWKSAPDEGYFQEKIAFHFKSAKGPWRVVIPLRGDALPQPEPTSSMGSSTSIR